MMPCLMPPIVVRTQKPCTNCGKEKRIGLFGPDPRTRDGHKSWCLLCANLQAREHRATDAHRAAQAEYRARPEVRERRRACDRARREAHSAWAKGYWKSYMGKLVKCRSNAKGKLKVAATEARRAHYRGVIAMCDREVARLKADHELPREPPRRRMGEKR